MTKEELEKEAEEYRKEKLEERKDKFVFELPEVYVADIKRAYLAGAEPREKRIKELIALINAERGRQEKCDDVHLRKIAELEKENAKLKEHLKCLLEGMYHIAQHHPTMGAHTKIMQDLREAEQFLNSEVEK